LLVPSLTPIPNLINGVWGLRPQRVQGRALAFLMEQTLCVAITI